MAGVPDSPQPRALLYARVSTDQQAEKYGLDAQIVGLRNRAAERGYTMVPDGARDAFTDDGYSGGDLNRPALERLRQTLRDCQADVVLCFDPDRLSRSLADLLVLADEVEGAGARLEFVTQEMDVSPEGRLFFSIRGAVAEFEKAKIRERMMRGKREKARQGKVVQPAKLPTWLRSEDGGTTVVFDAHWAEVARLVWQLFVQDGLTLRGVAQRLTVLGYATPTGGRQWQPTVIQRWLKNPAAHGDLVQFRYRAAAPHTRRKPVIATARRRPETTLIETAPAEWSHVPVPALVDAGTWGAAQARLARNQALARRNAHRPYLLAGLLVCGACGKHLAGSYHKPRDRRYYRCGGHSRLARVQGGGRCRAPAVSADTLEAAVWERIATLFRNPALLETELRRRRERGSPQRHGLDTQQRQGASRLAALSAEMDRLVDGYSKGLIPDDGMRRRMEALQAERRDLTQRQAELRQEQRQLDVIGKGKRPQSSSSKS